MINPLTVEIFIYVWLDITVNPRVYEPTFLRARMKLVLISKVLRLISRYQGSYLKGASCSPLESFTKMFSPVIGFGSVLMDLISNWGVE